MPIVDYIVIDCNPRTKPVNSRTRAERIEQVRVLPHAELHTTPNQQRQHCTYPAVTLKFSTSASEIFRSNKRVSHRTVERNVKTHAPIRHVRQSFNNSDELLYADRVRTLFDWLQDTLCMVQWWRGIVFNAGWSFCKPKGSYFLTDIISCNGNCTRVGRATEREKQISPWTEVSPHPSKISENLSPFRLQNVYSIMLAGTISICRGYYWVCYRSSHTTCTNNWQRYSLQ